MSSHIKIIEEFTSVIDKKQLDFDQLMTYCEGQGGLSGRVIFAGVRLMYRMLQIIDKSRGYVLIKNLPAPAVRIMEDWLDPVFVLNEEEGKAVPLDKYEEFIEFFKINFVNRRG